MSIPMKHFSILEVDYDLVSLCAFVVHNSLPSGEMLIRNFVSPMNLSTIGGHLLTLSRIFDILFEDRKSCVSSPIWQTSKV